MPDERDKLLKNRAAAAKPQEVCIECGGIGGEHADDCEDMIDTALLVEEPKDELEK